MKFLLISNFFFVWLLVSYLIFYFSGFEAFLYLILLNYFEIHLLLSLKKKLNKHTYILKIVYKLNGQLHITPMCCTLKQSNKYEISLWFILWHLVVFLF